MVNGTWAAAIAGIVALIVPIYKWRKGKAYEKAIKQYKQADIMRDLAATSDELYYWDGVCKSSAKTARSLYSLRASCDLGAGQ